MDCGFHRAGWEPAFFAESDAYRRRVLARHWPGVPIFDDVRDVEPDMGKMTAADVTRAAARYDAGESIAQVAASFGVTRQALWARLRKVTEMRPQARFGEDNHFHRGGAFGADWAHNKVEKAVKAGRLIRPNVCEQCGGPGVEYKDGRVRIQAHHDDYNKPLEVRWLCKGCHHDWHIDNQAVPLRGGEAEEVDDGLDALVGGFP